MTFKDKELQRLSQNILNRAVQRQTIASPVERIRQAIKKRIPKVDNGQ